MPPRAIVLIFDRLSRRCLGCYGHEWIETPNFDRLAARAVVFDQHFASPADPLECGETSPLWNRLRTAGIATQFVTEPPELADADQTDLERTPFARFISQAIAELRELAADPSRSWLLWLSSAGVAWPSVALETFAELYVDELQTDDGQPVDSLQAAEVAYAACVTQLDHLFGRLLTAIEQLFGDAAPLLIVAGLAGESLNESEPLPLSHVDSSPCLETWRLREEIVHTPLLIAHATGELLGNRHRELVQSSDLTETLCDWFGAVVSDQQTPSSRSLLPLLRNDEVSWREHICLCDDEGRAALRTNSFLLIESAVRQLCETREDAESSDGDQQTCQLFHKPEDIWEVNDVVEQHAETVAELRATLRGQWLAREATIARPTGDR